VVSELLTGGAGADTVLKREPDEADSPREATPIGPEGASPIRSARGRPQSNELDARQLLAISLYLAEPNKTKVAEQIGVAPKTLSRWFRNPAFAFEYSRQLDEVRVELWTQLVATKDLAWERLVLLMTRSEPAVALRATTWLLNQLLSSPRFLDRSAAIQTGITADLEGRELELLELAGVVLGGGAAPVDARSSGNGKGDSATDDRTDPERGGADDDGR
jgi:hypothetical protein